MYVLGVRVEVVISHTNTCVFVWFVWGKEGEMGGLEGAEDWRVPAHPALPH